MPRRRKYLSTLENLEKNHSVQGWKDQEKNSMEEKGNEIHK